MAREVGADHLMMLHASPPDLVSVVREAGFDLVSLRLVAPSPCEWPWPITQAPTLEETARRLYLTSVRVVTGVLAQRLRTRRNSDVKATDAAIS